MRASTKISELAPSTKFQSKLIIEKTHDYKKKLPKGFWSNKSNHKILFEDLGEHFGIRHLDDWYKLRGKDVNAIIGSTLLDKFYSGSLFEALSSVYKEHDWKPWRFEHTRWLSEAKKQKDFFEWASTKLNIQKLDDWYSVTTNQLRSLGGGGLLTHKYNGSLYEALKTIYPNHNWVPWKFKSVPKGFWQNHQNQVSFMTSVSSELGIKQLDDWYSKSNKELISKGMGSILSHHNNSLFALLKAVYPEHNWKPWRFSHIPKKYWESLDNVIKFVVDASEQLSIVNLDDWYRVSIEDINRLGARSLLPRFGGFYGLLTTVYPQYTWNPIMFWTPRKRTTQRLLKAVLKEIFPGEEIMEDYPVGRINLDLFMPTLKLAIEYQGKHHYQTIPYFGPHDKYKTLESAKQFQCEKSGITLVEIPFWWNKTKASIAATILHQRKDLKHLEDIAVGADPLQLSAIPTKL